MAQDEKTAEEAAPPKSKKALLIIVVVVVLVLILGGAAAFFLMGGKDKKHGGHADTEESTDAEHAKPLPTVAFEEKFLVNLRSEDGTSHFMQVPKVELEMASEEAAKKFEERKSKVSDRINSTLRNKSMKEMLEPGSDIKLKEELKAVVNQALEVKPADANKKGVKEVILPASFIVQ
jgi:flagellar FliL protein